MIPEIKFRTGDIVGTIDPGDPGGGHEFIDVKSYPPKRYTGRSFVGRLVAPNSLIKVSWSVEFLMLVDDPGYLHRTNDEVIKYCGTYPGSEKEMEDWYQYIEALPARLIVHLATRPDFLDITTPDELVAADIILTYAKFKRSKKREVGSVRFDAITPSWIRGDDTIDPNWTEDQVQRYRRTHRAPSAPILVPILKNWQENWENWHDIQVSPLSVSVESLPG